MVEEKFYKLEDNTILVLIEHVVYDGKRYLLLNKENTDEVFIGYEENGSLVSIDSDYPKYDSIALSLLSKMMKN